MFDLQIADDFVVKKCDISCVRSYFNQNGEPRILLGWTGGRSILLSLKKHQATVMKNFDDMGFWAKRIELNKLAAHVENYRISRIDILSPNPTQGKD